MNLTDKNILPEIRKRRSIRALNDKEIPEKIIHRAVLAAQWAPSSFNEQPWKFVIGNKYKNPETYQKILASVNEWNYRWVQKAPLLFALIGKTFFDLDGRNNTYFSYDCGQAAAFLVLQLTKDNIFTHQIGGFDKEMLAKNLNIPKGYEPVVVIVAGYQGEISELPEDLQAEENKERTRKHLDKVGLNEWDKPYFNS